MALHVGVIGTGNWSRVHLRALTESPHVERVTLAGRNQQAARQLADDFPIVTLTLANDAELLADTSIEVVHIVLPHHLHCETTLAALAAGKHVICEKPAATSLEQFDAMVANAQSHQRRLLVVMNQLYNPVWIKLRELVDSGAIGRPFLSVENSFANASQKYRDPADWRCTPEQAGGGVLIDGAFHMVYRHLDTLATQGSPQWVLADTPQLNVDTTGTLLPGKCEDFVSAVVGYVQPLRIQWAHGWTLEAVPRRARQSFLAGSEATLELTDDAETPIMLHRDSVETPIAIDPGPRSGPETTHMCLLDYLQALTTGCEPLRGSLDLTRLALSVVLGAYASGESGERVGLDL